MHPNSILSKIALLLITFVDIRHVHSQRTASECGKSVAVSEPPRVRVNAVPEDADHGVWPWMAAMHLNAPSPTQSHFCDGVLIGESHVLTAAHCIDAKLSSEVRVHLGSLFTNLRLPGEQVIEAEEICVHKRFRSGQEMVLAQRVSVTLSGRSMTLR